MDDSQLDAELAALTGTPAEKSKPSEADTKGNEPETEAETETDEEDTEAEAEESDAGDNAGEEEEADGEESEDEKKDERPKKKLSGSERLKRRLAAAEAELASVRSRPAQSEADVASEVERIIGKPPKEEDYKGDYLAFERAQTAYELDKRQVTREVKGQAQRQEGLRAERRRDMAEAHQDRVEEFRGKAKDFDTILKGAGDLKASPTVEDLILDSDKSAHLVYFLAKNPSKLHALNDMSERQAAREIGRIESTLSLPQPKTKTKAPKPVTPPKGGAAPSSPDRDLDTWLSKTYGKK